jgi:hypothetical protein
MFRTRKIQAALLITLVAGIAVARSVQAEPAAGVVFTCSPDIVVSANVRVVAHCASGYFIDGNTSITWFAYPTKDSANASRMLSIFEVAKATGATVTFYFDTSDLSGGAYGCATNDCRAIWAATTP